MNMVIQNRFWDFLPDMVFRETFNVISHALHAGVPFSVASIFSHSFMSRNGFVSDSSVFRFGFIRGRLIRGRLIRGSIRGLFQLEHVRVERHRPPPVICKLDEWHVVVVSITDWHVVVVVL